MSARTGIGILGVTGYAGLELVRLIAAHPQAELRAIASRQHAGATLAAVWPSFASGDLVIDDVGVTPAEWVARGVEVVFAALPHGAFAAMAREYAARGLRVIDLSADFRLRDAAAYPRRYRFEHPAPELLEHAVYGLTEWCGAELEGATLISNPGCYATAILLATLPAIEAELWSGAPIVANALSGVSGAGRSPSLATHFVEVAGGAAPYRVGEEHAHLGEMEQALRRVSPELRAGDTPFLFNPHLVPMGRGIVASIAIPLDRAADVAAVRAIYRSRYASSPFVRVIEDETLPETRHVRGANRCDIALRVGARDRMLLVFAVIDNLTKGAAGQAIQNWNRSSGWAETLGLSRDGWGCA